MFGNKTLIFNNFEIYQNKYNIKIDKLKILNNKFLIEKNKIEQNINY